MTGGSGGVWCARCRHLITSHRGQYVHYSNDDWAGPSSECECTNYLVPCRPETAVPAVVRLARRLAP